MDAAPRLAGWADPLSTAEDRLGRRIARLGGAPEIRRVWATMATSLPCWLVGGFVRDQLLGRPSRDLDLALDADIAAAAAPARALARACGTRAHLVGTAPHAVWRITTGDLTVELWPRGELDLAGDIMRRDYSVNALAYRLPAGPIIDLAGGLDDLVRHRLRAVRRANLADDPVRILRAARFRATHPEFALDERTAGWVRELAPRVGSAPRERVGKELATLLGAAAASQGLDALLELDLLAPTAPAPGQVDPRWLRRRTAAATLLARPAHHPLRAAARAAEGVAGLALLARAWGTPSAVETAPYAWPKEVRHHACAAAATLDDAAAIVAAGSVADRRELLWRTGAASPALLAAGAAIAAATGDAIGPWRRMWRLWRSQRDELLEPKPLLAPAELIELLGLDGPGPAVGHALQRLARARARGELRTPAQARRLLLREQ